MHDLESRVAFQYAADTRCVVTYERRFFRPVFESSRLVANDRSMQAHQCAVLDLAR
jgi:hypothetical protein